MAPTDQTLPSKEATLFKLLLKLYEGKQYKKALKTADTILKKFPEHGETLAMKGLVYTSTDRKKEGLDLVKSGLKHNMKSHICWHVLGLVHRAEKDFKEAVKCYKQAHARDKDNAQISRDLASMQIQMRDIKGYRETRHHLLESNSKQRVNWIALAVAAHLENDFLYADKVLKAYESTVQEFSEGDKSYEHSEMLLYANMVIFESGNLEKALRHLDEIQLKVIDRISHREAKGKILLALGRNKEAEDVYRKLMAVNEENHNYHRGLLSSLGITLPLPTEAVTISVEQELNLLAQYSEIQKLFPKSTSCKRIPLDFLSGERFRAAFDLYVRSWLRRGIPSLFTDLKSLYNSPEKIAIIGEIFHSYLESLNSTQKFPPLTGTSTPAEMTESPEVTLWVFYFLALHYDQQNKWKEAIKFIDEAIAHTPTVIDLYMAKGVISRHSGNPALGSDLCERGRKMDLADRYLNTISVKNALRANRLELADSVVTLFTKDGENPDNLVEMQTMWFELRYGSACLRLGHLGRALKKFNAVEKHFLDILDDQFDFHSYCLRKMTIRSYVELIRLEDRVHGHKFYVKAALGIIRTYLILADKPYAQVKKEAEDAEFGGLSESERKKILSKRRREEARQAALKADTKKKEEKTDGKKKKAPEDSDPEGLTLVQIDNPLDICVKQLQNLEIFAKSNIAVHHIGTEVWIRRNKPLRALVCAKRALKMDPTHPDTHRSVVRFLSMLRKRRAELPAPVLTVIDSEIEQHFSGIIDPEVLNARFLSAHPSSLAHRFAVSQVALEIEGGQASRADVLSWILAPTVELGVDIEIAQQVHQWLKKTDPAAASQFFDRSKRHFEFSTYFNPELLAQPAADDAETLSC